MSKLARLVSQMEGFDVVGSQPQRKNNPGDLRHSPHSSHEGEGPEDIGVIDTPEHGWADLERQLQLEATRGLNLRQLVYIYAPPNENDSSRYLKFLCDGMGMGEATLVFEALKVP